MKMVKLCRFSFAIDFCTPRKRKAVSRGRATCSVTEGKRLSDGAAPFSYCPILLLPSQLLLCLSERKYSDFKCLRAHSTLMVQFRLETYFRSKLADHPIYCTLLHVTEVPWSTAIQFFWCKLKPVNKPSNNPASTGKHITKCEVKLPKTHINVNQHQVFQQQNIGCLHSRSSPDDADVA